MRVPILAAVVGAIVSLLVCGWHYQNGSFDFGLHYSLIAYIYDNWHLPTGADRYIEAMRGYPAGAHAAAAIMGVPFGSPIVGMHLMTILAIFTAYASLFWLMRFRSASPTWLAFGATITVLYFARHDRFSLGLEVVGNYFFAQIVGTACLMGFVAVQQRVHAVAAVTVVFLLGWVYPLAAVQLACITTIWMALQRDAAWKIGTFAICAAAAIYFHPLFQQSVVNGSNNGDIGTGLLPPWAIYPATALLVLMSGTLAFEYYRGRLKLVSGPAFVATGLGVAAAAVVQMLAFHGLGKGSQYLVSKHLFLVVTLLLMTTAVLGAHLTRVEGGAPSKVAFAICAFLALTAIFDPRVGQSVRAAATLEKAIRSDPDAAASAAQTDRFALRVGVLRVPVHEAFATR
jgi:hypothetical protein